MVAASFLVDTLADVAFIADGVQATRARYPPVAAAAAAAASPPSVGVVGARPLPPVVDLPARLTQATAAALIASDGGNHDMHVDNGGADDWPGVDVAVDMQHQVAAIDSVQALRARLDDELASVHAVCQRMLDTFCPKIAGYTKPGVAILHNPAFEKHEAPDAGHPECPDRLRWILGALAQYETMESNFGDFIESSRAATSGELCYAHDASYVDKTLKLLRSLEQAGRDGSTVDRAVVVPDDSEPQVCQIVWIDRLFFFF